MDLTHSDGCEQCEGVTLVIRGKKPGPWIAAACAKCGRFLPIVEEPL